mmetsp:Transcript_119168/g.344704  ORF Transcript_119168/g.344704 Transcript_119168/m.344704 type:complete len:333 (-) Transcript_119168:148-1146(-)
MQRIEQPQEIRHVGDRQDLGKPDRLRAIEDPKHHRGATPRHPRDQKQQAHSALALRRGEVDTRHQCADAGGYRRNADRWPNDTVLYRKIPEAVMSQRKEELVRAEAHRQPGKRVEALELQGSFPGQADMSPQVDADVLELVEASVVPMLFQAPRICVRRPPGVAEAAVAHGPRLPGRRHARGVVPLDVAGAGRARGQPLARRLVTCGPTAAERYPEHVLRPQGLECVSVGPRALKVLPLRHRQPHELRQHPHGGALGGDASMHGEPDRHEEVHERTAEGQHVKVQQPRRGARLQAAACEQPSAHAELQHSDDEVIVHLALRHLDDVPHIFSP